MNAQLHESMGAAPVRVLVAGAGAFGREHLARLAVRRDVTLAGVADANGEALTAACADFGVARGDMDPLQMIDATPADAIVVATPADSHVEICVRALAAGLCVLLEKPVACSASEAQSLAQAARGARGFVLPGHVLRFSRDHRRLVEIVRQGGVGEILYVGSRRYRDDRHATRYPDSDPILMTLIHDIDLAQWVTGSTFRSAFASRSGGPGFRAMTTVSAATATGAICELRTAWTFPGAEAPPDRLEIVGSRGGVELTVGQDLRVCSDGRIEIMPIDATDDALRNEHDHFLSRVVNRALPPVLGLDEAMAGLRLADAALESVRLGREIATAD